jgi:hypothetical protein
MHIMLISANLFASSDGARIRHHHGSVHAAADRVRQGAQFVPSVVHRRSVDIIERYAVEAGGLVESAELEFYQFLSLE